MNLRDEFQAIYETHGRLTPALVVQTARPEDHPLHFRVFDRPPEEAAESWYLYRAHELIQSVRVSYRIGDTADRSVRAFHAVQANEAGEGFVYEPTEKVASDPFLRQLVLRNMERDWKQLFTRYEQFEEFITLVSGDVKKAKGKKVA